MTGWRKPEFILISYAPHALRDESVNIAVAMIGDGFADVRLVRDWQRVLSLDPDADIRVLEGLTSEIQDKLRNGRERAEMVAEMEQSFSNVIRVSPWKGCLTEDPEAEIERLAEHYL
jgi:hypothetical protein